MEAGKIGVVPWSVWKSSVAEVQSCHCGLAFLVQIMDNNTPSCCIVRYADWRRVGRVEYEGRAADFVRLFWEHPHLWSLLIFFPLTATTGSLVSIFTLTMRVWK